MSSVRKKKTTDIVRILESESLLTGIEMHPDTRMHAARFLKDNRDLIPVLKKSIRDCREVYPGATLIIELFADINDPDNVEMGLLIKCTPEQMESAMERFFELEDLGWGKDMVDYAGRFFIDLYGMHSFRGEEI